MMVSPAGLMLQQVSHRMHHCLSHTCHFTSTQPRSHSWPYRMCTSAFLRTPPTHHMLSMASPEHAGLLCRPAASSLPARGAGGADPSGALSILWPAEYQGGTQQQHDELLVGHRTVAKLNSGFKQPPCSLGAEVLRWMQELPTALLLQVSRSPRGQGGCWQALWAQGLQAA